MSRKSKIENFCACSLVCMCVSISLVDSFWNFSMKKRVGLFFHLVWFSKKSWAVYLLMLMLYLVCFIPYLEKFNNFQPMVCSLFMIFLLFFKLSLFLFRNGIPRFQTVCPFDLKLSRIIQMNTCTFHLHSFERFLSSIKHLFIWREKKNKRQSVFIQTQYWIASEPGSDDQKRNDEEKMRKKLNAIEEENCAQAHTKRSNRKNSKFSNLLELEIKRKQKQNEQSSNALNCWRNLFLVSGKVVNEEFNGCFNCRSANLHCVCCCYCCCLVDVIWVLMSQFSKRWFIYLFFSFIVPYFHLFYPLWL